MVQHTCIHCNYTTGLKSRLDTHLKSKRHLEILQLQEARDEESAKKYHDCPYCKKRYISKSGLWNHSRNCLPPQSASTPSLTLDPSLNLVLSQQIAHHTELLENVNTQLQTIVATAPVTINNNTTNNTNNTNNNNTLNLVCMNDRFGDAMNSTDFIESLEFNRRDFEVIDKCRFYVQGAHMVLESKMEGIPKERRPIRTQEVAGYDDGEDDEKVPEDNSIVPYDTDYQHKNPTPIYIRDRGKWTAECPAIVEYHLRNNGCSKPQNIPRVMFFLMQYGNKIYDTYQKMKPKDESLKRIDDKMMQSGRSQTHIELLYKIRQSKSYTVDSPESSDISGVIPVVMF